MDSRLRTPALEFQCPEFFNIFFPKWAKHCCDRKSWAGCAQSFAPRQQATIEIMCRNLLLLLARDTYIYIFVLHAHPICGESRNQHKMICMQNGKQKWYVNSLACHVVNIKAMKFFAYLGKNLCLRATPAIRAVESEVLSSGSGQFRLSDSNSASRLPPTFSCISYLKW